MLFPKFSENIMLKLTLKHYIKESYKFNKKNYEPLHSKNTQLKILNLG